jgi:hypothetical protein
VDVFGGYTIAPGLKFFAILLTVAHKFQRFSIAKSGKGVKSVKIYQK